MSNPPDVKVTTEVLWRATLMLAPFDALFVAILVRRVKADRFRALRWTLTAVLGLLFLAIWGVLCCWWFWEPVYQYLFPESARWFLPPVYGLLFAALGLLSWWLALRFRGYPVLNFCLLGGFWGMASHALAIQRGLLDKPPMLQGASPVATVVFPAFEFIFYWCISLTLAALVQGARDKLKGSNHNPAPRVGPLSP